MTRILDVSCGAGIISEALARLGAEVTAIDACEENIVAARRHKEADTSGQDHCLISSLNHVDLLISGLPNLSYLCISVEELAATDTDKFDAVVASEVIEHVDNQEMFVGICSR